MGSVTFMMKPGSSTIFAADNQSDRDKLRRCGWQRVTRPNAARTMGSEGALNDAVARCTRGEIERTSDMGTITFICHGDRPLL